ncbi:MAG: elongation factor G [Actinomycetota bacterium]|nr:elongation factor G [Actinomycetota bacterium]
MKVHPPDRVRNVALVGHGGSGKTTLAEALLHHAGVTSRVGRVEDGTTVCDSEPEEVRRHTTLSLAVAPFEVSCPGLGEHKVNLLDTPGDPDFVADVIAALGVADLAVFVVSAVEGVQVGTEATWRLAAELGVPRMVFVNKLDRERSSFERTLDQLRDRLGAGVAPLELPIGEERAFSGVADLLTDRAFLYDGSGAPVEGDVPEELAEREHEVHDALVEGIVVGDDDLLERYLGGDTPTFAELEHVLADGVAAVSVFPVVCGSATQGIGVDRLAQYLCEIGPSPATRPPVAVRAGTTLTDVAPDPSGPPLAVVFKTVADPFVGRISLCKVLSGTIRLDDHLVNPRTGAEERLHNLFLVRGKDHVEAREVAAGDIVAVAKLADTLTGDTLAPRGMPVVVLPPPAPEPVHTVAVRARTQADDDKLSTALHRLQEEDPALRFRRDDETHQTLLDGLGETHLAVAMERLERKFGVRVDTEEVRIAYRETVSSTAEAEGRHKKQSGGHGQFGVAVVRVEPLPRGGGFEFVDAVVGGAVPRQLIPAVERGVREAMAAGGPHGHPVVDVRVTLLDGKHHPVDSSEMSFRAAGSLAFREAVARAQPVVLEPVSIVEVTVPDELQGEVLGDLNARRGRVQGSEPTGDGHHLVTAAVPAAALRRYAVDLRSLTGGRARFRARPDHHDPVPPALVERVDAPVGA